MTTFSTQRGPQRADFARWGASGVPNARTLRVGVREGQRSQRICYRYRESGVGSRESGIDLSREFYAYYRHTERRAMVSCDRAV